MAEEQKVDIISIDRLYDYTRFHIGMYATLVAFLMGLIGLDKQILDLNSIQRTVIFLVACMFALAGAFGGIVCANCLRYPKDKMVSQDEPALFWGVKIPHWTLQKCADSEHLFFWIGIILALYGVSIQI